MDKVIGLIIFLGISISANAQQQHTKELLQGTWTLSGARSIPSFISYRSVYNTIDSFKTVNVLTDSIIQLKFNYDTLTIFQFSDYKNDTNQYIFDISSEGLWINLWPSGKKKKRKYRKRLILDI